LKLAAFNAIQVSFANLNISITSRCTYLVQQNETNDLGGGNGNVASNRLSVSTSLSNTTGVPQTVPVPILTQLPYEKLEIVIQPKLDWHRRNMKELGKQQIPLLAGHGSQRTLVRVKVSIMLMYKEDSNNKTHIIFRFLLEDLIQCILVLGF
jgi:hypothetical protein